MRYGVEISMTTGEQSYECRTNEALKHILFLRDFCEVSKLDSGVTMLNSLEDLVLEKGSHECRHSGRLN